MRIASHWRARAGAAQARCLLLTQGSKPGCRWRAYYRGMSRKNLSLIVGAASLAMAAALWSSAAIAQSALSTGARAGGARPVWSYAGRASLATPRPVTADAHSEDYR